MRRYWIYAILLLIFITGCAQRSDVVSFDNETGRVPIKLNLAPAIEQGLRISRIIVTIARDDFIESLELTIDGETARGVFNELQPGDYSITVNIYQDDEIVATGTGSASVVAGETTMAMINLEFVEPTGDLDIIVTWGEIPERILFIGNSYTYANGGLGNILEQIVWGQDPFAWVEIDEITGGGMTLANHFNTPSTVTAITEGNYDVVILQEQSQMPYMDQANFFEYATRLDSLIDNSGVNMDHDAPLALNIYNSDQSHPSQEGSYLAGLCFYMRLFRETPLGVGWTFSTTTDEYRDYLQQVAWDTCFGYTP